MHTVIIKIGVSLCIYVGIILSNRNIGKENSFLSFFFMVEIPTPSKPSIFEGNTVQIDPKSMRKE